MWRNLCLLAWRSAWFRKFGLAWVVLSIALSSFLLLTVERIRHDVRHNFSSAVSGTDLIVGARTGSAQLLLYSVFRIGQATHHIRYSSLQKLEQDSRVAWVVPLSLGDSHRGFPVVGTSAAYFDHFRYGDQRALVLAQGRRFEQTFEAVIGAQVAKALGYHLGQSMILRHGAGEIESNDHADQPFTVVGILENTGTPVDRSVHISLAGMEALHLEWWAGAPMGGLKNAGPRMSDHSLTPRFVTAALVGLKSRSAVFSVQRQISNFEAEPLLAILPGVALDELWTGIEMIENALFLMSGLVALVSLAGLIAVVLTALEPRRRELAVLRSIGAGPVRILALLGLEGFLLSSCGALWGLLTWVVALWLVAPWVQAHYGLSLTMGALTDHEALLVVGVLCAGTVASLLPAWRAYHLALIDGLSPRGG